MRVTVVTFSSGEVNQCIRKSRIETGKSSATDLLEEEAVAHREEKERASTLY